jgi:hypothetical protein
MAAASITAVSLQSAESFALEKKLATTHYAQEQDWSCGVNVARMWAKFISPAYTYNISDMTPYTGQDGTTIPELMDAIYYNTPVGYCFAEWEYANKYEAVKGIVWTLEKLDQPLAIAGQVYNGNPGMHYYLVRGYKGTHPLNKDGYAGYPDFKVDGIYVEDTVYLSSYYGSGANYESIGKYAVSSNTLITSSSLTTSYWTPIGGWFDKKYRSVERVTNCAQNDMTLENNTVRNSY